MSEKTYVFPEGSGNGGLDPNLLLSMNGGFGGGNYFNNPIWALIFLAAFQNGGMFGNGGGANCNLNSIREQLNDNQNSTLLMDAIKGNAGAVHELATAINCDFNAVNAAINGVQSSICNVGNQVGMSSAQIINSIQNGNMSLANQLQSCCCDVRQDVTKMGYENQINNLQQSNMITKGFGDIAFATQAQTTALAANQDANTRAIIGKLDQIEDSRKDREIASLTAALTAANSRAERAAELAPILQMLNDIQCKQPKTENVYAPSVAAIPSCVAWQAGLNGLGLTPFGWNNGQWS